MATALGAAPVLATAWLVQPPFVSVSPKESLEPAPSSAPGPVDPPETLDLLARVVELLRETSAGLPSSDLRAHLAESSESIQRALAAGIRAKQLRRVGAHNKLRYLLNA